MEKNLRQTILDTVREFSTSERPVYLVGGAVRDLLLNRPSHDLDFVMPGETRGLAREVACRLNGALYVLDEERDTTRVILEQGDQPGSRLLLDFATLRASDLQGDLRARDFTINAMAFDAAQPDRLLDPTGGLTDLREKRIRACLPDSLQQDPVRVLRAVRQALGFRFRIDPETLALMRKAAPLLPRISAERQRDELFRMLDGAQVSTALRILDQVGALQHILPELMDLKGLAQSAPHVADAWEHTLSVVQHLEQILPPLVGTYQQEKVPDLTIGSAVLWLGRYREQLGNHFRQVMVPDRSLRALLFLAALYHDIAKPHTRTVSAEGRVRFLDHPVQGARIAARRARALALSVAEVTRLETIVEHHMRVHHLTDALLREAGEEKPSRREEKPSRRSIYRFFKDTGEAGVDICLLSLADSRGTYEVALSQDLWQAELQVCRALLEAYWEKSEEVVSPPRYLSGTDLINNFGLEPGKMVGKLLEAIREAQAEGVVRDRAEAEEFARRWLKGSSSAQDS